MVLDVNFMARSKDGYYTWPKKDQSLYPSQGVYGNSTDFDISLIFKLLRTICNLTPRLLERA